MGASEAFLYTAGGRIEVASPSGGFESRAYLGQCQAGALFGGWCPTQHSDGVAICQVIEGFERCRVVLA